MNDVEDIRTLLAGTNPRPVVALTRAEQERADALLARLPVSSRRAPRWVWASTGVTVAVVLAVAAVLFSMGARSTRNPATAGSCGDPALDRPVTGTIATFSDCTGWVTGRGRTSLLRTTDDGRHWTSVDLPLRNHESLLSLTALSGQRARVLAVTQNPISGTDQVSDTFAVWATDDGGRQWTHTDFGAEGSAQDAMVFSDATHGMIAFGTLQDSPGLGNWHASIYTTNDGGSSWRPGPTVPFAGALALSTAGVAYIVDRGGQGLFRSEDLWTSWQHVTLPAGQRTDTLTAPLLPDADHGVYVSDGTAGLKIAVTTDGGTTWTASSTVPLANVNVAGTPFQALTPTDWVYLVNGTISWTHDAGTTWSRHAVSAPTSDLIGEIDFTSLTEGWGRIHVYDSGGMPQFCAKPSCPSAAPIPLTDELLHTADGGLTWTEVSAPSATP